MLLGEKAKEKNLTGLVLDIGLSASVKGSRIYAVLAGVLDSGLKVAHSPEILPSKERITGNHINEFASKIKGKESFEKQFKGYIKKDIDPLAISKRFEDIKSKIIGGEHEREK